jgi:hypothetical protein
MNRGDGVWRWNVDDVWQSYSSMYQEAALAGTATNDIARYHHLSASLLFGGCAIEAFLNAHMRAYCEGKGQGESETLKKLRYTPLREKLDGWPQVLGDAEIEPDYKNTITTFLDLRNEVTHRRRRDHSLYVELDEARIIQFVTALQRTLVSVYVGMRKVFPYWIFGWNYVGFNGDESFPCLLNNQQFQWSLSRIGFDVPAGDYGRANEWEQRYMTSMEGFIAINEHIYNYSPDIEPRSPCFPKIPRLCKKWWDRGLIAQ